MARRPKLVRRAFAALGDFELAMRASHADGEAFGELVNRSAPAAKRLLRRMGATHATADDVTQDALVAALRSIETFRGDAPFTSWINKIAARLYVKRCRKEARYLLMTEPMSLETPEQSESRALADRMDLDRALALLAPIERLCVSLCHGAGFTHVEIADDTHLPLGTVKSHVTRGLQKLRRNMLGEGHLGGSKECERQ
jgi:RNA polymerase sigma factor (sigma-70 family)